MGRNYYLLWLSYLVTQVGNWVYLIALPLVVYDLTGSGLYMASLYGVEFLPWILFSLFGGLIADKYNKKKVIMAGNLASAILIGVLLVAVNLPTLNLPVIFITVFCLSSINPLTHPSFNSIIPLLVTNQHIVKANSSIQLIENIITLLGPMVGGGAIAFIGGKQALFIDIAAYLLGSLFVALLKYTEAPKESEVKRKTRIKEDLWVGIQYTYRNKVIFYGSLLFFFTNLAINAFQSNFMYYLAHTLKLDSATIGLTLGLQGIGPLIGAFFAPYLNNRISSGKLILFSTSLAGLATFFLLGAKTYWQVALIQAIALTFGNINVITYFSLRQRIVPSELLGRVVSVTRMISYSSIPLSSFLAGWAINEGITIYSIILFSASLRFLVGALGFLTPLSEDKKQLDSYANKPNIEV
ncbi:MFS transporter [Laceyella putida]|uniref:MFS transporter n=1 Tax=Laceyella putida TaxID=110101 RepID=A0ABW2RQ26_9BACL